MAGQTENHAAAARHRARAFGLEIDCSFDASGLAPATGPPSGREVRLDLRPVEEVDRVWAGERSNGERTIDVHPRLGYRLFARGFGLATVTPDGAEIVCAPPGDGEPWSWERFLVGRVLPWAAVLAGYEVLHASAIGLAGRTVAFVGPTGSGKTSLALELMARGADFVTDDVLALEQDPSGVRAHPGAGVAAVRPDEPAALSPTALGTVLAQSGKTYLAVPRVPGPLPVAAVCFLTEGGGPAVEPLEPDARLLLASTFVLGVRTPARLRNQLDVCSAIARQVPLFRVHTGAGIDPSELASAVHRHFAQTAPAR